MSKTSRQELAEAILKLIESKKSPATLSKEIAGYLVEERRTSELDMIMRDVNTLRQQKGVLEAVIISAFPISRQIINDVTKLLQRQFPVAKTILIDQRIDTNLIGGIRIEAGGKQLDTSIRTKLTKLKSAIA